MAQDADDNSCATFGLVPPYDPPNTLTPQEEAEGWILLFDGKNPERYWRGYGRPDFPSGWQAIGGCLVRVAPAGDIITRFPVRNFELRLEWRISEGGNSGIFYRVIEQPGRPAYYSGPEMQILDDLAHPDGLNPLTSAGSNYGLYAPSRNVLRPVGQFNSVRIRVVDNHVEHWLNGVLVVSYELHSEDWKRRVAASKFAAWPEYGQAESGFIALQDHGDMVWFRNIKLLPLD